MYSTLDVDELLGQRQHDQPRFCGASACLAPDLGSTLSLLEQTVCAMHEDLRAYLFLFVGASCVGNCAAACSHLLACLWNDGAFWRNYAGPCLSAEPNAKSAGALRDTFRRWLFNLEGEWPLDFQAAVDEASRSEFGADFVQLFADARYVTSGLMPCDDAQELVRFTGILRNLLVEYNPVQLDERKAAEALILQVEKRSDVFTEEQLSIVSVAYDESLDRGATEDNDLDELVSEPDAPFDLLENDWGDPEADDWTWRAVRSCVVIVVQRGRIRVSGSNLLMVHLAYGGCTRQQHSAR
eukprot:CAMPEP_0117522260 /NCGR_PEP_ID=MMETSP0784-20121206/34115_1 /TAXON_ID=39447 /ORGANISM="" /LENGTH=296 /DNA_ID=CAMNT_0005318325 /DNA_START=28 /DNA_END=920 /DNA_ORIENTATION=-